MGRGEGGGGGELERPSWRGGIKGVGGPKPMFEDDGGWVGRGGKNFSGQ